MVRNLSCPIHNWDAGQDGMTPDRPQSYADELVTSHGAKSEIEDDPMRHGERARACLPEPLPWCPEFG